MGASSGIYALEGHVPSLGEARVDPTAAVIGRVTAGPGLQVGAYTVLRGDGEPITLGRDAWLDQGCTVHITGGRHPTVVGDRLRAAPLSIIHACELGDDVVVGAGAVILDGARIGDGAVIAPGAMVTPRKELAGGRVYAGRPARDAGPADDAARARALAPTGSEAPAEHALAPILDPDLRTLSDSASTGECRFVAPTAKLLGRVSLAEDTGVWFGVILDGRSGHIRVGARSNVQENSLLRPGNGELFIGERVTVGHHVRIGAATIGSRCLIGMGAVIEDDVIIEDDSFVAAMAHVTRGSIVRSGDLWAGGPAARFRAVKDAEWDDYARGNDSYVANAAAFADTLTALR